MADVITFGEAMIRLSPPGFQRIEQASALDLHVGGSELNVAVGLSRLGVNCAWVSRLPRNALGRLIEGRARQAGVDTSHLAWTDEGRAGLYFVEFGAAPRPSTVLYDRARSATCDLQPHEIDWQRLLAGAKWFHTSGITPALSHSVAAATKQALQTARGAGLTVSYDLNFRSKLWSREKAREMQEPLMEYVHILVTAEGDAGRVFDVYPRREPEARDFHTIDVEAYAEVAQRLQQRFGFKAVAITLRGNPSVWRNTWRAIVYADGNCYQGAEHTVEVVDRIGTGDAFSAGLIYGCLVHRSYEHGLRYGTACAALKHSHPGDFSWATSEEVNALLQGNNLRITR
jgi:2-dehydro-3-deoxygluconokinase